MISLDNEIQQITNVYKKGYFGIGDYLRGCVFLSQLCIRQKKQFVMNYSEHPISEFLYSIDNSHIPENNIITYPNKFNYNDYISFLNKRKRNNICVITNLFPSKPIHKNVFMNVLRQFEPKPELIQSIQDYLLETNLEKNKFTVIHLRLGDNILISKENISYFAFFKIIEILKKILNPKQKYLILSDNHFIKVIIHKYFPFTSFKNTNITHLGVSPNMESNSVLDTLTEFFIMKHCNHIISFSTYTHRTSFGEMASLLFYKPFTYYSLLKKQMSIQI
jgi:hypothetical protein